MTLLWRYTTEREGLNTAPTPGPQWAAFTDRGQISAWYGAEKALMWANYHGLVIDNDDGELSPRNTASRVEGAALLHRFITAFG